MKERKEWWKESDRFPSRIMYGMIQRMYAYVRTNGYVGTVFIRLVVERVNERDPCVNGQGMHDYVLKHALSRVYASACQGLCKVCHSTYVPLEHHA